MRSILSNGARPACCSGSVARTPARPAQKAITLDNALASDVLKVTPPFPDQLDWPLTASGSPARIWRREVNKGSLQYRAILDGQYCLTVVQGYRRGGVAPRALHELQPSLHEQPDAHHQTPCPRTDDCIIHVSVNAKLGSCLYLIHDVNVAS